MRKRTYSLDVVFRTAAVWLTTGLACTSPLWAQPVKPGTVRPTAVTGESWLKHLQRSFDETSMGKTGRLGPSPSEATSEATTELTRTAGEASAQWQMRLAFETRNETPGDGKVLLHGSDLYRMNCRGCHGETGMGAPPEINSVINPVRATSAAAVMERMRISGMEMSRSDAATLAQQSKALLLDRLHHGGQDMPAFPHLSAAEVNSLVAYLRELAGVRGAEAEQLAVREEKVRVGEHIAKSTCHICHSADGPNPTPQDLHEGAVPPLSTLALRTNRAQFIRKVTHGAAIEMGMPPQWYRGRMPVFYYLSEDEAADVYLYLTSYPPYAGAALAAANTTSRPEEATNTEPSQQASVAFSAAFDEPDRGHAPTATSTSHIADFPVLAGVLVTLLLGLGFAFTVFEIRRLSENRKLEVPIEDTDAENAEQLDTELVA